MSARCRVTASPPPSPAMPMYRQAVTNVSRNVPAQGSPACRPREADHVAVTGTASPRGEDEADYLGDVLVAARLPGVVPESPPALLSGRGPLHQRHHAQRQVVAF